MRHAALAGHFVLVSLPLLGMLLVLMWVFDSEAQAIAAFRIHKWQNPSFQSLIRFITDWGNPILYIPFLAILYRGWKHHDKRRTRYTLTYVVVQLLICFVLVNLTKMALGRPRPETGEYLYRFLTFDPHYHSLPSGHSAEIMGSCLALALWLKRWRTTLLLGLFAAAMGFSRVYLNMHFPTDVFFGWLFGACAGWTTYVFGGGEDSPHHG
ncbi:phosphatase PAP2 family protein [Desulfovibrio ferrophilus]|uniref:Phosphoesterase PA-phosphatase related protein n=1 Tax=Desulfovibrio ferrophilus TaxID=241368 RepID=A0A2Z6AUL5_9BACT|nr:phosphatase PAP2 family protein [Desulfovibrio ferrophilus]BBD06924.1 phosphoesterase PA-phosphatase related protein [Desulfovibrio ferrophilus]